MNDPDFSPPQFHRVSAFLFQEIWPQLVAEKLGKREALEKLQIFMSGLAISDLALFKNRWTEKTESDFVRAFREDFETSLWIASEVLKAKADWFSRKVAFIDERSESTGKELWITMVIQADRNASGDYWGSREFQIFFERNFSLKITTGEDRTRFENALKNKRRAIRRAEEKHRRLFEKLVIDAAVENEASEKGDSAGENLRKWFAEDQTARVCSYLRTIFKLHAQKSKKTSASLLAMRMGLIPTKSLFNAIEARRRGMDAADREKSGS
ncbi:MAG: hypothetical protein KDN19_03540 [Verrucomicrobiae bacterium]|nr:hypothetical protein [Verrucomicrobiae bacterium]